jgi:hypothetical protein
MVKASATRSSATSTLPSSASNPRAARSAPHRVAHVVQRLQQGDQRHPGLGGEVGGVADHEADPVGDARLGRPGAALGEHLARVQVGTGGHGSSIVATAG